MKKIFTFLIIVSLLSLTGCASKNKTDNETNSNDTSGYKEQPQDKTKMNDTMPTLNTDTIQH